VKTVLQANRLNADILHCFTNAVDFITSDTVVSHEGNSTARLQHTVGRGQWRI